MTSLPHSVRTHAMSLHVPEMNEPIAQLMTWFRKNWPSGQTVLTQFAVQVKMSGGMPPPPPMPPKQPNTQIRPSEQLRFSGHVPQSREQFVQLSKPRAGSVSHTMLPHTEQVPQSLAQLAQSSRAPQRPSPQPVHRPQSPGHVKQVSVAASHMPSPHVRHASQSGEQVRQSSPSEARQKPSPQVSQRPQS